MTGLRRNTRSHRTAPYMYLIPGSHDPGNQEPPEAIYFTGAPLKTVSFLATRNVLLVSNFFLCYRLPESHFTLFWRTQQYGKSRFYPTITGHAWPAIATCPNPNITYPLVFLGFYSDCEVQQCWKAKFIASFHKSARFAWHYQQLSPGWHANLKYLSIMWPYSS